MRILVIEDEAAIADFIDRGLRAEGYEVESVGDGDAGLDRAVASDVDLVVLDRMLPRRDGLDVLVRIRAVKPALPADRDHEQAQAADVGGLDRRVTRVGAQEAARQGVLLLLGPRRLVAVRAPEPEQLRLVGGRRLTRDLEGQEARGDPEGLDRQIAPGGGGQCAGDRGDRRGSYLPGEPGRVGAQLVIDLGLELRSRAPVDGEEGDREGADEEDRHGQGQPPAQRPSGRLSHRRRSGTRRPGRSRSAAGLPPG